MKLYAKSAIVSGAIFVVVAIIYGLYRLARALHAGMRLLNDCKDYECDKCPTEGLCGLHKDEKYFSLATGTSDARASGAFFLL